MNLPFETPFGKINLECDNHDDASIQAWNQADHYLMNKLSEEISQGQSTRPKVAIINDDWGALSLSTCQFDCEVYSDSAIFDYWLQKNNPTNDVSIHVKPIDELINTSATIILLRLPKTLSYFEHILSILSQLKRVTIYIAGMQKYWPNSFYKAAHHYFSEVLVFDAIKKAKCAKLSQGKALASTAEIALTFDEFNLIVINHPNVFSQQSLDMGTRFFLENFPDLSQFKTCIDLACGNGLLGIQALKQFPELHCDFIDESFYATKSCQSSLAANKINAERYTIHHNNALHTLSMNKVDAILCNPPFHHLHRVGSHIANTMFKQSAEQLNTNGALYVIGNRHLAYEQLLKKYFSTVKPIAQNAKFILLKASNK